MMLFPTTSGCFFFLFLSVLSIVGQQPASSPATSMQKKLAFIESNAKSNPPSRHPTILAEQEINAYFASNEVELPDGVKSVRFSEQPGVITGNARVDFDQIKSGRSSYNPLLAMFSGTHDIVVIAHAHGTGGRGYVHADSVSLDGVSIPRFVLQLFVDRYLHPKYPDIGLDSEFELPDRIDTATVGQHQVTITQK
jgi:hypothetical protein